MRAPRRLHCAGLWLAASALAGVAAPAAATDLIDAWRAAQQHDLDFAVSRAAQQSGAARRSQAGALWRPNVMLSGTAGCRRQRHGGQRCPVLGAWPRHILVH